MNQVSDNIQPPWSAESRAFGDLPFLQNRSVSNDNEFVRILHFIHHNIQHKPPSFNFPSDFQSSPSFLFDSMNYFGVSPVSQPSGITSLSFGLNYFGSLGKGVVSSSSSSSYPLISSNSSISDVPSSSSSKNSSQIFNQKSEEIQNKQSSVRSVDSFKASNHYTHHKHHHKHHYVSHPPHLFANDRMKRKRYPAPIIN
jgi:hypothetical protein